MTLPAETGAAVTLGLQVQRTIVSSLAAAKTAADSRNAATMTGSDVELEQQLIKAAATIGQLVSAVERVQSAHAQSVKFAAALADAARLAQDGVIDAGTILDVAKRQMSANAVKLSALDGLFTQQPGDLVGEAKGSSNGAQLDVLTAYLRSLRR